MKSAGMHSNVLFCLLVALVTCCSADAKLTTLCQRSCREMYASEIGSKCMVRGRTRLKAVNSGTCRCEGGGYFPQLTGHEFHDGQGHTLFQYCCGDSPPTNTAFDCSKGETNGKQTKTAKNGTQTKIEVPAPRPKMPNYLIVGAQKAGTSAFWSWLSKFGRFRRSASPGHRYICSASKNQAPFYAEGRLKEVHFQGFTIEKLTNQSQMEYMEQFTHCDEDDITIEATPDYLSRADKVAFAYENQKKYLDVGFPTEKRLQVIIILREPVGRDLSWFNHRRCSESTHINVTFYDHAETTIRLIEEKNSYAYGLYSVWLERWFNFLGREKVLVLSYDEMKADPSTFFGRARAFLGLELKEGEEEKVVAQMVNSNSCAHKIHTPDCETQKLLADAYDEYNHKLYRLLEESGSGPSMEQKPFPKFNLGPCLQYHR